MSEIKRLDAGQEDRIQKLIDRFPDEKDTILSQLKADGFDTREFEDISLAEEAKALGGGLIEAFGFTPPEALKEENTRAGDINIPIIDQRVQPSRMIGRFAPELAATGMATKVIKGAKLAKEAGKAGKAASTLARVTEKEIGKEAVREGIGGAGGQAAQEIGLQAEDPNRTLVDSLVAIIGWGAAGATLGAGGQYLIDSAKNVLKAVKAGVKANPTDVEAAKTVLSKVGNEEAAAQLDMFQESVRGFEGTPLGEHFFGKPKGEPQVVTRGQAAQQRRQAAREGMEEAAAKEEQMRKLGGLETARAATVPQAPQTPQDVQAAFRLSEPQGGGPSPSGTTSRKITAINDINDLGPNPINPQKPGPVSAEATQGILQLGAPEPRKLLPPSPLVRPGGVVIIDDVVTTLAPQVSTGQVGFVEAMQRIEDSVGPMVPDMEVSLALTDATSRAIKAIERGDMSPQELQIFTRRVMTSIDKTEALSRIRDFAPDPDISPDVRPDPILRTMGKPQVSTQELSGKITQAGDLTQLKELVEVDIAAALENGSINQSTANRLIAQAGRRGQALDPKGAPIALGNLGPGRGTQQVFVKLKNGEELSGQYQGLVNDRTISLKTESGTHYVDLSDIENQSVLRNIAGGAPDPSDQILATQAQSRKYYALVDDIKRMGGDTGKIEGLSGMSRRKAADRIRALEKQRTALNEKANESLLTEITIAAKGADDGIDLVTVDKDAIDLPDSWYKDPSATYTKFLTPEHSKFGLAANEGGRQVVELGQTMERNVVRRSRDFLDRIAQVTKGLDGTAKFKLVRALDGAGEVLNDPALKQAHDEVRKVLDEVADMLGLDRGQRIREYFPHLFDGELGKYRAIKMAQEIGDSWAERLAYREAVPDRIKGRYDVEAGTPLQRFFKNILPRQGVDGYELDFDKVIHAYVNGAVRKVETDIYLKKSATILRKIPNVDRLGRKMEARKFVAEHIAFAVGQPTSSRNLLAKAFFDSHTFNTGVDRLIEMVGGAPERGLMSKARELEILSRKIGNGMATAAERARFHSMKVDDALTFIEKLHTDAQKYLPTGEKVPFSVKKLRAEVALSLDRFRKALGNPMMRGIVAAAGYRFMLLTKLGLNVGNFFLNLTQTITNTWPLLNTRAVANGVVHFVQKDRAMLGGRTGRQVIHDSGILLDPVEFGEFSGRQGWAAKAQEIVLSPTRYSEEMNRSIAILGKYHDVLAKAGVKPGQKVSEEMHQRAIAEAAKMTEGAHFPFNRAGTPRAFRSPGTKLFFQFMTYPMMQTNFSAELIHNAIKNGDVSPLLKHIMAYSMLAGTGWATGTYIWDRSRPPVWDMMAQMQDDTFGGTDTMEVLAGPAGTSLIQAFKGHLEQAAMQALSGPAMTAAKQAGLVESKRRGEGLSEFLGPLRQKKPERRALQQ